MAVDLLWSVSCCKMVPYITITNVDLHNLRFGEYIVKNKYMKFWEYSYKVNICFIALIYLT